MTHKQHIDNDKLKASDAHLISSQCLEDCLGLNMNKLPVKILCWWLNEVVKQRLGLRLEVSVPGRT